MIYIYIFFNSALLCSTSPNNPELDASSNLHTDVAKWGADGGWRGSGRSPWWRPTAVADVPLPHPARLLQARSKVTGSLNKTRRENKELHISKL